MVDEDVAGTVVLEVGDLHAVWVSYLLWLESCIDGVHLDDCFGLLSLQGQWWTYMQRLQICHLTFWTEN